MGREAKRLTGSEYLCMAGGVALNCVANGKLHDAGIFRDIFITPASGDAGGALGAAYAAHHIYFGQERIIPEGKADLLKGSYLGPAYHEQDVEVMLRKYGAQAKYFDNDEELLSSVAGLIAEGNVIGWHQGRMEFGPRALGARSII